MAPRTTSEFCSHTDEGEALELPATRLARFGGMTFNHLIIDRGCFWPSMQRMQRRLDVSIDWDEHKAIGWATVDFDDEFVLATVHITDRDRFILHTHQSIFKVDWKLGLSVEETVWKNDGEHIVRAQIHGISLVDETTTVPRAQLQVVSGCEGLEVIDISRRERAVMQ